MHAPERLRIEIGLQLLDGPVIRFAFHTRCHHGDQTVVNGRVNDILRIHNEVAIVALHQKLSALRAQFNQRRITAAIDSAAGPKKPVQIGGIPTLRPKWIGEAWRVYRS